MWLRRIDCAFVLILTCACGSKPSHLARPDAASGAAGAPGEGGASGEGGTPGEGGTAGASGAAHEGGMSGSSDGSEAGAPNGCGPVGAPIVHDTRIEADETWGPGLH